MLLAAGIHYSPITIATKTTCNGPDPVGEVDEKVDRGIRRGLDGEFRSGVVLDDAPTDAVDQMDKEGVWPAKKESPLASASYHISCSSPAA
jgi:hypothetical protein